jgi:CubicO group peptidase (beta-lactamase class C family)
MMNKNIEGLNNLIQAAIDDGAFPGATYALVTPEGTFLGNLGNISLEPVKEPNALDTIYDMASVSKVVSTTTCLLQLIEQGKVRLYEKLATYVSEFLWKDVTIWDLMTHTSGLPADVIRAKEILSKEELWQRILLDHLIYPKNSKIVYSDLGYILLGRVVENVSGLTLDEYAKKFVFEPLMMKDTGYNPKDKMRCAPTEARNDKVYQGMMRGNVHDEKSYIMGGIAGHAGLFSTSEDLSHFIKMILNRGVYDGTRVLSGPTVDLLFKPQVEEITGISLDTDKRGLGWIVKGSFSSAGDLASDETILHTGFTGTNIWIDRKNQIGFCLLTNRVHPTRENLKIIDVRVRVGNYIIANFGK